jgi:hypothetical protein
MTTISDIARKVIQAVGALIIIIEAIIKAVN